MSATSTKRPWDQHLDHLFAAELQFRLAAAVRIAVTGRRQPLDFPEIWTHGFISVRYEEMALRQDQAEAAAEIIQHSATLTMAVAVKDALEAVVEELPSAVKRQNKMDEVARAIANSASKPWSVPEEQVAAAYHISRLVRNAYAHAPFAPRWKIREQYIDATFSIPNVIRLCTRGLDGNRFDWRHYGGLLALYKLCRFTRFEILGDERRARTNVPPRQRTLYQLGDVIVERVDKVPEGCVPVAAQLDADGGIALGRGYSIRSAHDSEVAAEHGAAPEESLEATL